MKKDGHAVAVLAIFSGILALVLFVSAVLVVPEFGVFVADAEPEVDALVVADAQALEERTALLYFFDVAHACVLDAHVTVNGEVLGESERGIFELREQDYDRLLTEDGVSIVIRGTTSGCFGADAGLPFVKTWKLQTLEQYFGSENRVYFRTHIEPRSPAEYAAMSGYVRPDEVSEYLATLRVDPDSSVFEALERLAAHPGTYVSDYTQFNEVEYWQTPAETLAHKGGDCEDWAVTTLSLFEAYDENLNCYSVVWRDHVSVLCMIDDRVVMYDQHNVVHSTTLDGDVTEDRKRVVRMLNSYFDAYGIRPNEREARAVFNSNDVVVFDGTDDFVSWLSDSSI